jgi:uncharacterized protein YukE
MPLHKPVKQNAEQMREVATDLAAGAADLQAICDGISQAGFTDLEVTHYDQLRRAREYVDNYVHAAKKALRDARESRGDFATPMKSGRSGKQPRLRVSPDA